MPVGGGDPKRLGDGMVVYLRPDAGRGNADLWDTFDAVVALIEYLDVIYASSQLADFNAFKAAMVAAPRTDYIQLLDRADGP